jgi:hypothetical protein
MVSSGIGADRASRLRVENNPRLKPPGSVKNARPKTLSAYKKTDVEGNVIFFMTAPCENTITIILPPGKGEVKEMIRKDDNLFFSLGAFPFFALCAKNASRRKPGYPLVSFSPAAKKDTASIPCANQNRSKPGFSKSLFRNQPDFGTSSCIWRFCLFLIFP